MSERPLILSTGAFWGRRLLAHLVERGKNELVLFHNEFDAEFTSSLGGRVLDKLDLPTADYASQLTLPSAIERCADTSVYPEWVEPTIASQLAEWAHSMLPLCVPLIERMKALHARTPIGAVLVYHDLNIYMTTALAAARELGIPSMHVLHTNFCGLVECGQPHNAEYEDIAAVWSEQCAVDFTPAGRYLERMAVVGSPELDKFYPLRSAEGRAKARQGLSLPADLPIVGYASTYEDTNAVWAADQPGFTWEAFRTFLRVFREAFPNNEAGLLVKLHPSSPQVEKHQEILDEEGVKAVAIVGRDDGQSLAACDLVVSLFPSGAMVDALMVDTLSLWVKTYNTLFPIYDRETWLPRCTPDEFDASLLRRALLDETYRDKYKRNFEAERMSYNVGADGKATERVLALIDRMTALVATSDNPWGEYYHKRLHIVRGEQRLLTGALARRAAL